MVVGKIRLFLSSGHVAEAIRHQLAWLYLPYVICPSGTHYRGEGGGIIKLIIK